eukprot:TRINITY_DN41130_c0_g1_i1.p1 TRINITY_DN41130_c0_g1~~TRINITY_DN41130_c0_g1_i1.p1  ORF type:complete len:659 (+),score=77.67 TRINITY_DN41130_c0_g1_i1:155-2131(+)
MEPTLSTASKLTKSQSSLQEDDTGFAALKNVFRCFRKKCVSEVVLGPRMQRRQRVIELQEQTTSKPRKFVLELVSSSPFNAFLGFMIFLNMMLIIKEADVRATSDDIPKWVDVTGMVILLTYAGELALKVFAHRLSFFTSLMNVLDACLVFTDLMSLGVSMVANDHEVASVVFFKVLRLLRIYRLFQGVMVFRELVFMIQGLISSVRAILFGTILIFAALTAWAILAVQFLHPQIRSLAADGVFDDCESCKDAFSSVGVSILSLTKTIVAGDSWGQLAIPLMLNNPLTALIIIPAFVSVQLGLVNVIAAVLVDRLSEARSSDDYFLYQVHQEELEKSYRQLEGLFKRLDADSGGSLTLDELVASYDSNQEFRAMLNVLDIKKADIPLVVEIMDEDVSGEVTFSEFVEKLHEIKHFNHHTLLVFIKQHCSMLRRGQVRAEEHFDVFSKDLHQVTDQLKSVRGATEETERQLRLLQAHVLPTADHMHAKTNCDFADQTTEGVSDSLELTPEREHECDRMTRHRSAILTARDLEEAHRVIQDLNYFAEVGRVPVAKIDDGVDDNVAPSDVAESNACSTTAPYDSKLLDVISVWRGGAHVDSVSGKTSSCPTVRRSLQASLAAFRSPSQPSVGACTGTSPSETESSQVSSVDGSLDVGTASV